MQEIIVGKILKPQGIKGEVKVKPIIDSLDRFSSFKVFYISKLKKCLSVEKINIRFGYAYIKFFDINTRNDAELLRNSNLIVNSQDFGHMDKDSYLLDDLIGLDVLYEGTSTCVGKIIDIEQFGSADIIHVLDANEREYQLPFLKTIFKDVCLDKKIIYVDKQNYEDMKI